MALVVNNLPANAGGIRDMGLIRKGLILAEEHSWGRAWQLTTVFLLGETHGQRSLAGYIHRVTKRQT